MTDNDLPTNELTPLGIEELFKLADRRDFLCENVPVCSNCESEQVQLMNGHEPARWRCRACGHWFNHEPAK